MSGRGEVQLWVAQRVTAVFLALFVLVHIATIVYAVRTGLGADQVLARTRGSVGIAAFYGLFVMCAAIHGSIGLRTIGIEWLRMSASRASLFAFAIGLALVALGLRAVYAVVTA